MKKNIHPKINILEIYCNCGNNFKTKSTINKDILKIEICNKCHPFYTGKQKIIDSSGRVEAFNKKFNINEKNG